MKQIAIFWCGPELIALEHLRIGDGRRITLALQHELRLIHASRHVHGQYEKQVDLLGGTRDGNLADDQRDKRQHAS